MTLPPPLLGRDALVAWRLHQATYTTTWDNGEGTFLAGGRWNSKGVRAVYCSLDPSTAILELAVHIGFTALDVTPHVLTAIEVDRTAVRVVMPMDVPNPRWLTPGIPSRDQQAFGDDLLTRHTFVAIPSTVCMASWNLIFIATNAASAYTVISREPFRIDARLTASGSR